MFRPTVAEIKWLLYRGKTDQTVLSCCHLVAEMCKFALGNWLLLKNDQKQIFLHVSPQCNKATKLFRPRQLKSVVWSLLLLFDLHRFPALERRVRADRLVVVVVVVDIVAVVHLVGGV